MSKNLISIEKSQLTDVLVLLASMWLVYVLQIFLFYDLSSFGIYPRTIMGFFRIPLAPWVHHSFSHIFFNSIPLLVLSFIVHLNGRAIFWKVTVMIILLGGLGTWLIGSSSLHGGASGLIMGYWSYIFTVAFLTRSLKSMFLAVITLLFYGGMIFVLLDLRANISWAGHASGFAAGVLTAWSLFKNKY